MRITFVLLKVCEEKLSDLKKYQKILQLSQNITITSTTSHSLDLFSYWHSWKQIQTSFA